MKVLTVFAILFFATLLGLIFYAHYDTKKFIESLPQAPAQQPEVAPGEKTPKPHEKGTAENEAEQHLDDTAPVPDTHGHFRESTDSHGHVHHAPASADSTSWEDALETDVPLPAEETGEETTSTVQLPPVSCLGRRSVPMGKSFTIERLSSRRLEIPRKSMPI